MSAWEKLVNRYANGRPICNCGQAYYTPCGIGATWDKEKNDWVNRTDMLACEYGCDTNLLTCKEEIAKRVLKEIE